MHFALTHAKSWYPLPHYHTPQDDDALTAVVNEVEAELEEAKTGGADEMKD